MQATHQRHAVLPLDVCMAHAEHAAHAKFSSGAAPLDPAGAACTKTMTKTNLGNFN